LSDNRIGPDSALQTVKPRPGSHGGVANSGGWWYGGRMVKLELRSSHWIVDQNNNIIFGKGRMDILETIERTGSINQTAKVLKMSYKTVWSKIKSTEKHLQVNVVHSDRRTGTHLTPAGRLLIKKFAKLRNQCLAADDHVFESIFFEPAGTTGRCGSD
jgi:molybdate transport system regulatory protein